MFPADSPLVLLLLHDYCYLNKCKYNFFSSLYFIKMFYPVIMRKKLTDISLGKVRNTFKRLLVSKELQQEHYFQMEIKHQHSSKPSQKWPTLIIIHFTYIIIIIHFSTEQY